MLLERAVGHAVKVILHADNSNGLIGDLVGRRMELHEQACDAGVAEPVCLARWTRTSSWSTPFGTRRRWGTS